ncbi:MAG: hypothetical protein IPO83_18040 [Chitinophagaceae bacterium]|nr:hypothetical protein [Chitinophagaceae bacterium]
MIKYQKAKLEIDLRGRHDGVRVDPSENSVSYPISKNSMVEVIDENINEVCIRVTYNNTGSAGIHNWETIKLWINRKYFGSVISFY